MIPCIKPWTNLFINDNQIKFCCWSPVVIGRLNKDTSLEDFWNGQEARHMREHILRNDFYEYCPEICPCLNGKTDSFQRFARNKKGFNKNEQLIYKEIKNSRTVLKSRPYEMTLAMDHSCSLRCIMCSSIQKEAGYVISEGIYKLTGQILDTLGLIFFTGGEPFYSERVARFIGHFKGKKPALKWGFITNGLNINMLLLKKLKIDHICVSIDAVTEDVYEKIRIGSNFRTVIGNLKELLNYRDNNYYFPIKITFVAMSLNYRQIPMAVDFFESLGLELEFRMLLSYQGYPEEFDLLNHKELWPDLWEVLEKARRMAKRKSTLNSLNILKHTARYFVAADLNREKEYCKSNPAS